MPLGTPPLPGRRRLRTRGSIGLGGRLVHAAVEGSLAVVSLTAAKDRVNKPRFTCANFRAGNRNAWGVPWGESEADHYVAVPWWAPVRRLILKYLNPGRPVSSVQQG